MTEPPPNVNAGTGPHSPLVRALGGIRDHLSQLEEFAGTEAGQAGARLKPVWQRATEGENRLPVAAAVALAIALQLSLPTKLSLRYPVLLPALETGLLIGLVVANPKKINRRSRPLRVASLTLIAAITADNIWSAGHLIRHLLNGTLGGDAGLLFASGGAIYLTNVIVFALWYWEFDRGGPVARMQGADPYPDFLFPQMTSPELARPGWAPTFMDYLYLSITNATAFSPTDTMPLTRTAKALMAIQSAVSLSVGALVVARAVNILK